MFSISYMKLAYLSTGTYAIAVFFDIIQWLVVLKSDFRFLRYKNYVAIF